MNRMKTALLKNDRYVVDKYLYKYTYYAMCALVAVFMFSEIGWLSACLFLLSLCASILLKLLPGRCEKMKINFIRGLFYVILHSFIMLFVVVTTLQRYFGKYEYPIFGIYGIIFLLNALFYMVLYKHIVYRNK